MAAAGGVCPFGVVTVVAGVECPNEADTLTTSTPLKIITLALKCPNNMKTH